MSRPPAQRGSDLSIAQRLALGFAFTLLPVALLAGLTLYEHTRIDRQQDHVDQVLRPSAAAALDAQTAYLRQGIALRAFVLTGDDARLAEYRNAEEQAGAALRRLERLPLPEADRQTLAALTAAAGRYDDAARRFSALVRQGIDDATRRAAERDLGLAREEVMARAVALADSQLRQEGAARGAVDAAQDRMGLAFAITAALILAASSAAGALTTRSIRHRVRRLVEAARALGRGDYAPALALAPVVERDAVDPALDDLWRDELRTLGSAVARAAHTLRQRDARVEAHARVADVLATTLDLEPLASGAIAGVAEYAGCEVGALYVYEPEAQLLRCVAGYALTAEAAALRLGEGIPGQAAAQRTTVVVRDLPSETPFTIRLGFDAAPPRTVAAVPLTAGSALLGVLVLASARDITGDALNFVQSAAQQLAISLQNALAHQRLGDLAAELQEKNEELAAQNEEIRSQYEQIQAQNEELEAQREELEAQNEALQVQRERLLAADRQKDEFLATATHELKTPITALKGHAQISLRRITNAAPEPAELREALTAIVEQADRVVVRVNRMLDASRATMGLLQLRPRETDLAALARDQVHEARARTTQHEIHFDVPADPVVGVWDALALEQVVGNLLDNAIRYSPNGGDIHVTLAAGDGEARLTVDDSGIGIPPEALPSLFQRYFRHSAAKQVTPKGMGIGLYVSHEIVRAHGGRIDVRSEPGKGAFFTVALPLHPAATAAPTGELAARASDPTRSLA